MLRGLMELGHPFTKRLVDPGRILNIGLVLSNCAGLKFTDLGNNVAANTSEREIFEADSKTHLSI